MWQDEGFTPGPEDPDVGGQWVSRFKSYLHQVDWTDRGNVNRALRVFETALADLDGQYLGGVRRCLERDGYTVVDGRLAGGPVGPPSARGLPRTNAALSAIEVSLAQVGLCRSRIRDNDAVTTDRVFELPDGAALVVDLADASPAVADELETWSLVVPDDQDPQTVRDPSAWSDLISAGPLVVATVEGVIGNAAFAAVPAAARWLSRRRSGGRLDAARAAERATGAIHAVTGLTTTDIQVTEASTDATGTWKITADLSDGRKAKVRLAGTGVCVSVRVH